MEPVFPHSLVVGILSFPGLMFFLFSLKEIMDEYQFKQKAILTEGQVVKALPSQYKSQRVEHVGGTGSTGVSSGGYLLWVEYRTEDGVYSAKSKHVFESAPKTVEVGYSPYDAKDIMIDGYYKSGRSKYYRLFAGVALGLVPIAIYWML